MIVFYYDKTKAEQGKLFCLGQEEKVLTEEEIKEQGKEELYSNVVTYTGETVLVGHPIVEGDTVRAATDKELIELGIKELEEGEILEGENIKTIDRPQPYPEAYEWQSPNWILNQELLPDGVWHNGSEFIIEPIPDYISYKWDRPSHSYIDTTTDLQRVEKEYNEYMQLTNTYDTELMQQEGVWADFKTFIQECRSYIQRAKKEVTILSGIPLPSEKLKDFFDHNFTTQEEEEFQR